MTETFGALARVFGRNSGSPKVQEVNDESKKPKASLAEAVKTSFPQLAEESKQLRQAIADLGKSISGVEFSLRRSGLHVSAWHRIAGGENENSGYVWSREIGYTRLGDSWHIAIREWSQEIGQEGEQTTYKFGDAPPWMCLEAAGKIPGLLEELIERTQDMRRKITAKISEVDELASLLETLAQETLGLDSDGTPACK